jgi:hypothetical protein
MAEQLGLARKWRAASSACFGVLEFTESLLSGLLTSWPSTLQSADIAGGDDDGLGAQFELTGDVTVGLHPRGKAPTQAAA